MNVDMYRRIAAVLLVVGMAGIGVCDLAKRDWKTAALGGLFAVANTLIFLVK